MGFFPNYTNIYPELKEVLDTRVQKTNSPWTEGGVSGLSTWVRMASAVQPGGLIIESVHGPDNFTLRYGDNSKPGIIGYELDMKTPVEIDGTGRGLRPSPIITGLSIDEKARGSLKIAKLNIKCYTLEQVNKISQYFLEPGFHVLLEWGWNVNDSWSQRLGGGGPINVCEMVSYDTWKTVKTKRKNSKYQYDAMLGIITGGGTKFSDGETYDLDVQLSAPGIAAEYMQTHRSGNNTNSDTTDSGNSFKPGKIAGSAKAGKIGVALFKQMFNDLPNQKKIAKIYNWFEKPDELGRVWPYEGNYVNFDPEVKEEIQEKLSQGKTIRSKGKKYEIPSDVSLLDGERFIRMEMAVEILNAYAFTLKPVQSSECSTKTRSMEINIRDSYCRAFPHMWSTDGTKLYIPNTTAPSFGLRQTLMESDNPEAIDYIPYTKLNDKDWLANLHPIVTKFPENDSRSGLNGSTNDPATGESRPTPFAFPCTYDLDESVITHSCDETVEPSKEKAGFWGWTKDLFINFDFFCDCLSKPNYTVRDVLYDMLNGMSGACNSLWNFQIQERPKCDDEEGPLELTVVDLNFSGEVQTDDGVAEFQARGTKSPFISCDFSVSTAGSMMSSVMIKKMSNGNVDGSADGTVPLLGNVFSLREDKVGTILNGIKATIEEEFGEDTETPVTEDADDAKEDAKARAFELFANKAGVISRVQDRNDKNNVMDDVLDADSDISKLLSVGTWDDPKALKDVELIDRGLNSKVKGQQEKSDNNKQNPPLGLATFSFDVHGVSGFKVGDKFRIQGIPEKYSAPSFFQVMKVDHNISGMNWTTSIQGELRLIGNE